MEAIRFAKALLAPRTANETGQVLNALGATSPHAPQRLSFESIARNSDVEIDINCRYQVSPAEFAALEHTAPEIASSIVQARLGQTFGNPAAIIQYLSSDDGRATLQAAQEQISKYIVSISSHREISLRLTIEPGGTVRGADQLGQIVAASLDSRLSPSQTLFSYFPADRALPLGEVPIQFGAGDAQQQMDSYNANPQLKYARLKSSIFSVVLEDDTGRERLAGDFQRIFQNVLKGRRLESVGINDRGLLSVRVADTANGRTFDIDSMSSGEKGLLLTFLLIERSIANDGLILLDEPELHLNPAVCKEVLGFFVSQYAAPRNAQAIICTHSPEILAGALDREECSLYHLRSESSLTKVRIRDEDEVASALRRLGSSQSETLLYRGTIFVEGPSDVELLEAGFEKLFARFKINDLGGRREVERQIVSLQGSESAGEDVPLAAFIFDLDDAPSELSSSPRVRLVQWKRRMLENYLLDMEILTDLLQDQEVVQQPLQNIGEVTRLFRDIANAQLTDTAVRKVYEARGYEDPKLRSTDIRNKTAEDAAKALYGRLSVVQEQVAGLEEASWIRSFLSDTDRMYQELQDEWERRWIDLCDGKRVFADLQRKIGLRISVSKFKRQAMIRMRLQASDSWRLMESLLRSIVD